MLFPAWRAFERGVEVRERHPGARRVEEPPPCDEVVPQLDHARDADMPGRLALGQELLDQPAVVLGEPALGSGEAVRARGRGAELSRVEGGIGLHARLYGT